jgi:hypothetical protein
MNEPEELTRDGETHATRDGPKRPSQTEFDAFSVDSYDFDSNTSIDDSFVSTADGAGGAAPAGGGREPRHRILGIEDNPWDARLIEAMLGSAVSEGVSVTLALTLQEGLD